MTITKISTAYSVEMNSNVNSKKLSDENHNISIYNGKIDELTLSGLNQFNAPSPTDQSNNSIHIQPGNVYSLGAINGKQLNVSIYKNGLTETNFTPLIDFSNITPGSTVTQYQMEVANQTSSYTDEEHRQENRLVGRLHDLLDLASGKISLDDYNSRESFPYVSNTQELLQQLGVDSSRSFSVNGSKFKFDDGNLTKI